MKVSRAWLQKYFSEPLPEGEALADLFTFHSFEVDAMEGDLFDLKVLPDRAGYALSHRGVASELAAALGAPLEKDPLRADIPPFPKTDALTVSIESPEKCGRYMAALVEGVQVGPSPEWLKRALESVGQRSINNVVDATNYVMLDIGQPLHAFDADKLTHDGGINVAVRSAKKDESIVTLSNETYTLDASVSVIADAHSGEPLALAGIKGGKSAEVTADTVNLVIESANFDGAVTRRAAQKLKLFTDASLRFQNRPSSELAAYGMRDVLALIVEIAGGKVVGVVDEYPAPATIAPITVTRANITAVLGADVSVEEISSALRRLDLPSTTTLEVFTVAPPFERTDLTIPEDIAEEVGRTIGYDGLTPKELTPLDTAPDQDRFHGIERMKDQLVEQGFVEVSTQSFVKKGDVVLANPLDKARPALRTSLEETLNEALVKAKQYAPLVLSPGAKPKLFEVGTVFPREDEHMELRMSERVEAWGEAAGTVDNLSLAKLEEYGRDYVPKRYELGAYQPFSAYPFVLRDIAAWTPTIVNVTEFLMIIQKICGPLLVRADLVDRFQKDGRTSLAARLVFQSFERTLTDEEVNSVMAELTDHFSGVGYSVR